MTDSVNMPKLKVGNYRHNKSGNMYEVVGIALDTENDVPLVLYRPLYSHEYGYELFARPYEMFTQTVELNGATMPRFEYIS